MRQAIHQPLHMTRVISFGFVTALLSLVQPIPTASAQQSIGLVTHETGGAGTQGQRIESSDPTHPYPTKSLEKKDGQLSIHKPHRLIRKPQSAPVASIEPSPADSSFLRSLPTPSPSLQSDPTTSQPKEPSSRNSSAEAAAPLATATATGSIAVGTTSAGTVPVAAASAGSSSSSGSGSTGGRSMSRLAAEMPGLAQLLNPPSAPVVPVNPAIGASPANLSFTAQQGGSNPTAQTLSISNTGGGTLNWSASTSTTWLSLSSASGTEAGTVTVNVTTGTLAAGSYSGSVILNATEASSVLVPVTFTVTTAPVPPAIGVSPTSFSFTATQGGSNPANQTLSISNTGGGTLTWSASDDATWLTAAPASGTGNGTMTVSVVTGTLTTGTHTGTITLTATGAANRTVPVTFTVTTAPVPPAIGASPTSFSFTATQGGSNPANQTLSISNTGGGTLTWSASDDATWLTAAPASGTGNGTMTVSVVTGTLTTGTHTGTITLTATGATPVTVPVTFTVTAPVATPTIGLSPTTFSFTATQGAADPAPKTLNITNPGTGTLTWSVTDNASWLTLTPVSGTTTTGTSPVTLSVNTLGLLAGPFTATITVTATTATNSPQTIPVTLTLSPPATSTAALSWNANTEPDLDGYNIYQATASGGYSTTPIATVPKTATSYVATGLQVGTTYYFVIKAFDTAGNESLPSNEVSKSIF